MAIQMITLATITDRCDFARMLDREAFGTRQQAEEWAREVIADLKADEPDGPFDPVATFDPICLTTPDPIAYLDGRDAEADTAATELDKARRADAWSRLDEARD